MTSNDSDDRSRSSLLPYGSAIFVSLGLAIGWLSWLQPGMLPDVDSAPSNLPGDTGTDASDGRGPDTFAALVACKRAVFDALPSSSDAQFPSIYAPNAVVCEGDVCTLDAHVETGLGRRDFHCEVEHTASGWTTHDVTFR